MLTKTPQSADVDVTFGAIWERSENLSFDVAVRAVREDEVWGYEGRIGVTWAIAPARK